MHSTARVAKPAEETTLSLSWNPQRDSKSQNLLYLTPPILINEF